VKNLPKLIIFSKNTACREKMKLFRDKKNFPIVGDQDFFLEIQSLHFFQKKI